MRSVSPMTQGKKMQLTEVKSEEIKDLSITQLDSFHAEIVEQRQKYDEHRKQSNEFHAGLKEMQSKFIAILETLERTSYKSRRGTFSFYYPERFKLVDKLGFFDWFQSKYGSESLVGLQSINSQTLNSWGKEYITEMTDAGVFDVQVPGLEKSTGEPIASMRK